MDHYDTPNRQIQKPSPDRLAARCCPVLKHDRGNDSLRVARARPPVSPVLDFTSDSSHQPVEGRKDMRDYIPILLPELTRRRFVDIFEIPLVRGRIKQLPQHALPVPPPPPEACNLCQSYPRVWISGCVNKRLTCLNHNRCNSVLDANGSRKLKRL